MPRIRLYDHPLRDYGTKRHDAERWRSWRQSRAAFMQGARVYRAESLGDHRFNAEFQEAIRYARDSHRRAMHYLRRLKTPAGMEREKWSPTFLHPVAK